MLLWLRLRLRVKSLVDDLPLAVDFQQRHVVGEFNRRVIEYDDADAGVACDLDAFDTAFALRLVGRGLAGEARGEFGRGHLIEFAVAERKDFGFGVKGFPHKLAVAGRMAFEIIFERNAGGLLLGALRLGAGTQGGESPEVKLLFADIPIPANS